MRKIIILVFCLIEIGCSSTNKVSSDNNSMVYFNDKEIVNTLIERTDSLPTNSQLSIALIKNKRINFIGVYKTKDTIEIIENKNKVFEIGSISKVFTSTILSNLVLKNELELNDPIQKHLNIQMLDVGKITLKQLANHSSGLPVQASNFFMTDFNNPYKDYGAINLEEYLKSDVILNSTSGSHYEYSNVGVGLLGYILMKKSKLTYEQLLADNICAKYNLKNTTSVRKNVEELLVKGLDFTGEETSNWDMNVLVGAGGVLSSVDDLAKFTMAQLNSNKELLLTHKSTLSAGEHMEVGLGWHIINLENGNQWLWHNGKTGGYTSSLSMDKSNNSAVIILSNVSAFSMQSNEIDILGNKLMHIMYNE